MQISPDTIILERRAWRFNTEDSFCDQIVGASGGNFFSSTLPQLLPEKNCILTLNLQQLEESDETNIAASSKGNVIAVMGKFLYASDDALRQIPPPNKQKGHPQQAYLSPHGRFILTIEEKSEQRLLQAHRIDEDFRGIETCGYVFADFQVLLAYESLCHKNFSSIFV